MFERSLEPYWLSGLARYAPEKVVILLSKIKRDNQKLSGLLPIVLPLLPVGEALRLQDLFGLNLSEETVSEPSKVDAGKT